MAVIQLLLTQRMCVCVNYTELEYEVVCIPGNRHFSYYFGYLFAGLSLRGPVECGLTF